MAGEVDQNVDPVGDDTRSNTVIDPSTVGYRSWVSTLQSLGEQEAATAGSLPVHLGKRPVAGIEPTVPYVFSVPSSPGLLQR
jgi:hypothetical protein